MTAKQNAKTIALLVCATLLLSNIAIAFEQSFDLNSDGRLNDLDIIVVKRAIENGQCGSTKSCDLDGSGKFDMGDYNKIYDSLYGGFSQASTATGTVNLGTATATQTTTGVIPANAVKINSGEQFKLSQGMTAVMESTDGFKLYLSGTEQMNCLRAGQCPPSAAHVELRPRDGVPRVWTIQEKGEEYFGNYKLMVYSADTSSQSASFIVTRQGATSINHELEPVQIRPGSPFKLNLQQYGYVEGIFKMRLNELTPSRCAGQQSASPTAATSDCKPTIARLTISLADGGGEFHHDIPFGAELDITDKYSLKFTESPTIDVAVFLLEEKITTPETTQSVQVTIGELFKLKTGWRAFKLGSDGFEFTVAAIDLPNCAQPIAPAQVNPAVAASNAIAMPAPTAVAYAPMPALTQGIPVQIPPRPCQSGAVAIKISQGTQRLEPGQTIGLTDKYTLSTLEVRGLADGQRVAVMIVKDQTDEALEIPLGREFGLAVGQKSESNTDPYFSLTLTGINQVQCIRAPCPAHAELRLETKDRGDFEMSIGEGMAEPRAGLTISVLKTDVSKKSSTLVVTRTGGSNCPVFSPPAPGWCNDGKVLPGGINAMGCQGPPICDRGQAGTPMPGSDRDAHGCIGSAGYTWCDAKQKCLRTWEESCGGAPIPGQPAVPEKCNGCTVDDKCIAIGVRIKDPKKDVPVYCDVDETFSVQKINGEGCQNSYECSSNTCADSKCTSLDERLGGIEKQVAEQKGMLDKLVGFFKKIFGFGE